MSTTSAGVSYALGQQKMAPLQIRVVIICWILNTLDGFDLFVIAFAAPVIRPVPTSVNRTALPLPASLRGSLAPTAFPRRWCSYTA